MWSSPLQSVVSVVAREISLVCFCHFLCGRTWPLHHSTEQPLTCSLFLQHYTQHKNNSRTLHSQWISTLPQLPATVPATTVSHLPIVANLVFVCRPPTTMMVYCNRLTLAGFAAVWSSRHTTLLHSPLLYFPSWPHLLPSSSFIVAFEFHCQAFD